jgi:ubiquinone biosynthesis protein UbiJ
MASAAEQAVRRLEAALRGLETAIAQRLAPLPDASRPAHEVEQLSADKARLADSLNQLQARAARLETANRDVSRRLGVAVETIREILQTSDEQPPQ